MANEVVPDVVIVERARRSGDADLTKLGPETMMAVKVSIARQVGLRKELAERITGSTYNQMVENAQALLEEVAMANQDLAISDPQVVRQMTVQELAATMRRKAYSSGRNL